MFTDLFGHEQRYEPPAGYVQPEGSQHFHAAEDRQRISRQGFQHEQYSGNDVTMRAMFGTCLEPLIIEGQHAAISRPLKHAELLVDGGLYVIEWSIEGEVPEQGRLIREKYGLSATDKITVAKFLRYVFGGWYIQCNEALAPLKGEVIAKVISIVPRTHYTDCTAQMAPNSITDSYANVVSAGPSVTGGSQTSFLVGAFTVPPLSAAASLHVRMEYESHTHSGTTFGSSDNAYWNVGGANTALTNQVRQSWILDAGDAAASQVTNVSVIPFSAGQSPTFGVTVSSTAGSGTVTIKNIRYSILVLKK